MRPFNVVFPARFVYLAGPICGCNEGEANDWRKYVDELLQPHGIVGISPLRCEPLKGDRYTISHPDPRFGVPRAISSKNRFDVRLCDVTLAFLPILYDDEGKQRVQSYGTLQELAWADEAGKQTILVSTDPYVMGHPVVDATAGWKLETLDEAVDVIIGVLGGYTGGKNV